MPEDFVFAVKGSRFITHNKKLEDIHLALANFFASGVLVLGRRLGPIPPQRKGRDVYVYFDNDQHAHAPRDAGRLQERLAS